MRADTIRCRQRPTCSIIPRCTWPTIDRSRRPMSVRPPTSAAAPSSTWTRTRPRASYWKGPAESPSDTMYVIGNSLLKKSPRFDIVNQLMLPPPGSPAIKELNYRRTNLQKDSRTTSPGIPYPKRTTNWMRTLSASTAAVSRERDQGRPRITKPRPAR